jgi:hypothetical protein
MPTQKNEGEGNRTAARQYNKAQTAFANSGKVGPAAQRAKKALDSSEGQELKRAEETGRARAENRRSQSSQKRPSR